MIYDFRAYFHEKPIPAAALPVKDHPVICLDN